ncbi:glutathione S-transferase [Pseudomonas violetae]|jgi:glutathione S-transferase|uniref:Glutathione S-transferase n=1 Tax=Pseudomonas violetae TaxID=2915813 RepID=A0ABT0EU60_9PSED|nr:glutathione S-transferase [Pseudomonas violetae]MCK1789261.1 glutathione S-transferase [Pseudomonas violetae]
MITLYSFRRCPYAMRARMALRYSALAVSIVEVSLKAKPPEMLALSPKGTVPVLSIDDAVIDESLAIMRWALAQNDPQDWLLKDDPAGQAQICTLIEENDQVFKVHLNQYKYAERYPEQPMEFYRAEGEVFLRKLEGLLEGRGLPTDCGSQPAGDGVSGKAASTDRPSRAGSFPQGRDYLLGDHCSLADVALMPFVRQFAHVDREWFAGTPYVRLQAWLQRFLESDLFTAVMKK